MQLGKNQTVQNYSRTIKAIKHQYRPRSLNNITQRPNYMTWQSANWRTIAFSPNDNQPETAHSDRTYMWSVFVCRKALQSCCNNAAFGLDDNTRCTSVTIRGWYSKLLLATVCGNADGNGSSSNTRKKTFARYNKHSQRLIPLTAA